MKKLLNIFLLLGAVSIASAQKINNYKYVLIPETYEFTGEVDEYRLNSLTKFLFEKEGFSTYMKKEEKPTDLRNNPCLGLTTRMENNSGLFVTKLVFILEDCHGNVVFRSAEGRSREKEYEEAYQEALRAAFESIKEIDHHYSPKASIDNQEEIQISEAEVENEIEEIEEVEEGEEVEEIENIEESNQETEDEVVEIENSTAPEKYYMYSGKIFQLKPSDAGLGLYQKESPEPIAILIESNDGNSYIYNSLTNQGIAYFDAKNNLIVEYFSRQENKKITLRYELMD